MYTIISLFSSSSFSFSNENEEKTELKIIKKKKKKTLKPQPCVFNLYELSASRIYFQI